MERWPTESAGLSKYYLENIQGNKPFRIIYYSSNIYIFQVDVNSDRVFAIIVSFAAAGTVTQVFIFQDPGFVPRSLLIIN